MHPHSVLVVDDEQSVRDSLRMILEYEGYRVTTRENGPTALQWLEEHTPDAVLLDIKMPGMDGMEVLENITRKKPEIPVIILTGHGTIEGAVEAVKTGAYDFLSKPPDREKILIVLRNAIEQNALKRENKEMRARIEGEEDIIGESEGIHTVLETIARVAPTDVRVLITGENGTGKELVAKAIHRKSARSDKPLVEVNCAAIPSELIESELFGHEKGAFTGATSKRIGKFEQADGGTIFLDEVGDMSLQAQAKVLRVLQEGKFERVGGSELIKVDVRVIAATNKNLPEEIKVGRFREDLYHRLNVIPLNVPPLRERREDVPLLVNYFLDKVIRRNNFPQRTFSTGAMELLRSLDWPGNVRELRNAVERLVIMSQGPEITADDVQQFVLGRTDVFKELLTMNATWQEFKERMEKSFLQYHLERRQWNITRTAEDLAIQRSHLYTKLKKYGLTKDGSE